jgi:hypothetical protein
MLKRANLIYEIALILVLSLSLIPAELEITVNNPSQEVFQNSIFNITVAVKCNTTCNNFSVGIKIPDLEKVRYNFSESEQPDCFGGTCLSKPEGKGPLYLSQGNANWGCGKCFLNPIFSGQRMTNLVEIGCVNGMKNIAGVNLCLETDNKERWDIVFQSWPVGGSGDFVYERSIEKGILRSTDSKPFYIINNENLLLNFLEGQSKTIIFELNATGEINQNYNLILFAGDKDSDSIRVKILQQPPVNTANQTNESPVLESLKNDNHYISRQSTNSETIQKENYTLQSDITNEQNTLDNNLVGDVIAIENKEKSSRIAYSRIILGISSIVVLIIVFVILRSIRKNKNTTVNYNNL